MEIEVLMKCIEIFQRLGWEVSREEKVDGYNFYFDIVLRHNGKVYGVVEVVEKDTLRNREQELNMLMNTYLVEYKPLVFIITNGFKYDVYHYGEFYGSLTVPPTPENVDLLFGGEDNA